MNQLSIRQREKYMLLVNQNKSFFTIIRVTSPLVYLSMYDLPLFLFHILCRIKISKQKKFSIQYMSIISQRLFSLVIEPHTPSNGTPVDLARRHW